MVHVDYEGIRDGPENGTPHCSPLGQLTFCSKGEQVPRDGFWHRERSHARRLHIPHDMNIVVDAVARVLLEVVCGTQEARHKMGWAKGEWNLVFYVDGGRTEGKDHIWVQDALSVTVGPTWKI